MNAAKTFLLGMFERVIALSMLVVLLPTLLLMTLFIQTNSDGPVFVADEMVAKDGRLSRCYQFRTTGRGTAAFRYVGRFLRSYSIDDLPGLWSVACGGLRLGDLDLFRRR
jgi:lipopolysaccharide/colanic/teichoic acid biosynthesis glycosyltransferase